MSGPGRWRAAAAKAVEIGAWQEPYTLTSDPANVLIIVIMVVLRISIYLYGVYGSSKQEPPVHPVIEMDALIVQVGWIDGNAGGRGGRTAAPYLPRQTAKKREREREKESECFNSVVCQRPILAGTMNNFLFSTVFAMYCKNWRRHLDAVVNVVMEAVVTGASEDDERQAVPLKSTSTSTGTSTTRKATQAARLLRALARSLHNSD